jgi:NAD(P)H-quinone oxidoreductase subunit 5
MNPSETWSLALRGLPMAIPVAFALAALLRPRRAETAGAAGLGIALLVSLVAIGQGPTRGEDSLVRIDAVSCVMLVLVTGIGLVIARYSRTYLQGDPGVARYFRGLLVTLSAVTALVIANNLLVIAAAWTATSFALHELLTFYGDRTAALVAAHKKFLVSRLADLCLWTCLALVHLTVGSLSLDRIFAWVGAHPALTPTMHGAAVLLVVAVALKSAQLPFHGWLLQVMEAPTPVSALLHAGIVNIGGFLMIRLAPWMAQATAAQALLVAIGLVTTVIAALVMTTRVSVKVGLAWSTCAQMGFMLVQCGLGVWHLALLHLVAHSLYKAHAFLSAGTAVEAWRLREMTTPRPRPSLLALCMATLVALGAATTALTLVGRLGPRHDLGDGVLATLLGLSVAPMLARRRGDALATGMGLASATGVGLLYMVWHSAAAYVLPGTPSEHAPGTVSWIAVGVGFAVLFALKTEFLLRPSGRLARALYPWLFAGFYLDEYFTRLTFRLWPPRLQRPGIVPAISIRPTVQVRT